MQENKGILYERKIREVLENGLPDRVTLLPDIGGQFNAHAADLYFQVDSEVFGVEVKSWRSQVGEISFSYDPGLCSPFRPAKDIQPHFSDMVETILQEVKNDLDKLLDFLQDQEPRNFHRESCSRFRLWTTKAAWAAAKGKGLLVPINQKFRFDSSMIINHYNQKAGGVYYMHIENSGMFFLGKNPLNLPIPELQTGLDIEIRLKRSGSKFNRMIGEKTADVGIIAAGRLCRPPVVSPVGLDSPEKLFADFRKRH